MLRPETIVKLVDRKLNFLAFGEFLPYRATILLLCFQLAGEEFQKENKALIEAAEFAQEGEYVIDMALIGGITTLHLKNVALYIMQSISRT